MKLHHDAPREHLYLEETPSAFVPDLRPRMVPTIPDIGPDIYQIIQFF